MGKGKIFRCMITLGANRKFSFLVTAKNFYDAHELGLQELCIVFDKYSEEAIRKNFSMHEEVLYSEEETCE
ncbi:hypothetical protein LCGC14_1763910 [marine sediment metagenome]|uniref:Uncharacterized protein n=1 Tax=marine sediment metagenome TaxID=412755 RepID=A0A0F9JZW9_9ZZZZ